MNRKMKFMGSMVVALAVMVCCGPVKPSVAEIDEAMKSKVIAIVDEALKEQIIESGTLDVYDGALNKVRNLRAIKKLNDFTQKDGQYFIQRDYRDINSGDVVIIEIGVVEDADGLVVDTLGIKNIQKLDQGEGQEDKEYTDEEIQEVMHDYVKQQTRFNEGILQLFDKDTEKMRNLELTEITGEVRRMGIYYNSRAHFTDADSGEILDVDIAVEKKKGKLKIQALRIRNVRRAPVN